jgi:hypothetical protein
MPKAPKMGQLVQVSATTYVAELGNVPNPDFSGLLDEGKGQYASTEQQRSMIAKYDNPERRTRGLLPVFEEKHSLSEFAECFNQDLLRGSLRVFVTNCNTTYCYYCSCPVRSTPLSDVSNSRCFSLTSSWGEVSRPIPQFYKSAANISGVESSCADSFTISWSLIIHVSPSCRMM